MLIGILMFLAAILVFLAVFLLYGLPMEPFLYAAGLCGLLGLSVLAVCVLKTVRKHRLYAEALKDPMWMLEGLPEARDLIEKDARQMMNALSGLLLKVQAEIENERQDSRDYFNMWVHQIKTPIAVLRLSLQTEDTRQNREMLNELIAMEQYADMALGYARLNHGTKDLVIGEVSLDGTIRASIRTFAPLLIEKRIFVKYAGTDKTAVSDERWLRFMLDQVMSNAVKYTPSGSLAVEVLDGPVIQITDTGIGITPEDVPRVFEKGYTGYNGRGDKKSTGLGLYLLRRTADMLGHRVSLSSETGKGTTVSIDLARENVYSE